eukprot:1048856_1
MTQYHTLEDTQDVTFTVLYAAMYFEFSGMVRSYSWKVLLTILVLLVSNQLNVDGADQIDTELHHDLGGDNKSVQTSDANVERNVSKIVIVEEAGTTDVSQIGGLQNEENDANETDLNETDLKEHADATRSDSHNNDSPNGSNVVNQPQQPIESDGLAVQLPDLIQISTYDDSNGSQNDVSQTDSNVVNQAQQQVEPNNQILEKSHDDIQISERSDSN